MFDRLSLQVKIIVIIAAIIPWVRKHALRGAVSIFNLTNHGNYRDVYNTVTSP